MDAEDVGRMGLYRANSSKPALLAVYGMVECSFVVRATSCHRTYRLEIAPPHELGTTFLFTRAEPV